MKTPFETALEEIKSGKLKTPSVSMGSKNVDYVFYQLTTHHFNLKILASGMKFRNVNLTDLKKYYGLKGRSAKDCLPQFEKILEDYKASLIPPSISEVLS